MRRKSRTILTLEKLEYNVPLKDEDFTLQALAESAVRALLLLLIFAVPANAQEFTYRGFGQIQSTVYPQSTPQNHEHGVVEALFRIESAYKPAEWLTLSGSIDARIDTMEQVEREWRFDVQDRGVQRPAFSLREGRATVRRGTLALDLGKQFVRWGKTDILNPTDRFAPRDFLEVTDNEFLAVIGARGQYERGAHSIDLVWVPVFTPSRPPLIGGRWAPLQPQTFGTTGFLDLGPVFPTRSQYGARWNVIGPGFEASLSYFDGFNHLPQYTTIPLSGRPLVALRRTYEPLAHGRRGRSRPTPLVHGERRNRVALHDEPER